jgi:hypothetical protein
MSCHIFLKIKPIEVACGVPQEILAFLNKGQESVQIFYLF